jgi:hypothetical protein
MRTMAVQMTGRGVLVYPSTIAKIEAGKRAVQVNELSVYADLFGTSIDTLVGRANSDLAWAVSKLTSNAQKMAADIEGLSRRLRSEFDDVRATVGVGGEAVDELFAVAGSTILQLVVAQDWLNKLANQFPLPG